MKTLIIHGQSHKGSTYHLATMLAEKLNGETTEFFLPKDFGEFCAGCTNCFTDSETACPHYGQLEPITKAIDDADVIIMASPVYVFHATGAMKNLLDHYGYRWMAHRPEEKMFRKQAVIISTAAGMGTNSANKDMADSIFYWGIAKTYKYGVAVAETSYDRVSDKRKQKIEKKISQIAAKIAKKAGNVKPGIKTKAMFSIMRMAQKNGWNQADMAYWKEKGWLDKKRPW